MRKVPKKPSNSPISAGSCVSMPETFKIFYSQTGSQSSILDCITLSGVPRRQALVQRDQRGRSGPIRSGRLCDADGIRASGIDHAVEDSDADGCFGLLAGQLSGMQVVTEDALVACHGGFRLGPLAIIGFPLPAQAALVGKGLDMPIALRRFGAWSRHGHAARRDDDRGGGIAPGNGLVGRFAVISAIRHDGVDGPRGLVQQRTDLAGIALAATAVCVKSGSLCSVMSPDDAEARVQALQI